MLSTYTALFSSSKCFIDLPGPPSHLGGGRGAGLIFPVCWYKSKLGLRYNKTNLAFIIYMGDTDTRDVRNYQEKKREIIWSLYNLHGMATFGTACMVLMPLHRHKSCREGRLKMIKGNQGMGDLPPKRRHRSFILFGNKTTKGRTGRRFIKLAMVKRKWIERLFFCSLA